MIPTERPNAEQMRQEAICSNGSPMCPYCECRDFRVLRTWWTKSGEKHSSMVCRHCGKFEFNARVEKIITPI